MSHAQHLNSFLDNRLPTYVEMSALQGLAAMSSRCMQQATLTHTFTPASTTNLLYFDQVDWRERKARSNSLAECRGLWLTQLKSNSSSRRSSPTTSCSGCKRRLTHEIDVTNEDSSSDVSSCEEGSDDSDTESTKRPKRRKLLVHRHNILSHNETIKQFIVGR